MKIFLKILGSFFALFIVLLASVSIASHARVYEVNHKAKEDIHKMLVEHEQLKAQPLMTPVQQ